MDITIHLTDGGSYVFRQEADDLAGMILQASSPNKIFRQKQLTINGKTSLTQISTHSIEYIEFSGCPLKPNWPKPPNVSKVTIISPERFKNAMKKFQETAPELKAGIEPGEEAMGYGELVMTSGKTYYTCQTLTTGGKIDQRVAVAHMTEMGAIGAEVEDGCHAVINLATLVRWTAYPGPKETPVNAWPARRIG